MSSTLAEKLAALTGVIEARSDIKQLLLRKYYGKRKHVDLDFAGVHARYSTEDFFSNHWFFQGTDARNNFVYEPAVLTLLAEKLPEHGNFVDVGANIGYFSVFASLLLPESRVVSFEMDSTLAPIIRRNLELNGITNCALEGGAVGDAEASVTYTPHAFSFLGMISGIDPRPFEVQLTTRVIRLDDYFGRGPARPTFMKMDIDGAEMSGLRGMVNLLSEPGFEMLLEVHDFYLPRFGSSISEVFAFLSGFGFSFYALGEFRRVTRLTLNRVEDPNSLTAKSGDMLFVTRKTI